jgi:hypothetical protein
VTAGKVVGISPSRNSYHRDDRIARRPAAVERRPKMNAIATVPADLASSVAAATMVESDRAAC